jgi:pilus assembly protein CpaF
MFSVIISEKGGAERRETFDRTEINVGRVQGNDLMLPKGNVSKRHARLLHRDGRFIVTDLKSTNGTYVNGRKIAQATIVREGDKIYIGDFVLRIEGSAGAAPGAPAPGAVEDTGNVGRGGSAPPDDGPGSSPLAEAPPPNRPAAAPAPPAVAAAPVPPAFGPSVSPSQAPGVAPGLPAAYAPPVYEGGGGKPGASPAEPPSSSQPPSAAERAIRPPSPRIEPKTGDRHEVISHFPLEHDPDESVHFAVPAPPRMPSAPKPPIAQTMPVPAPAPAPAAPPPGFARGAAPPAAPPPPPVAPPPVARPDEAAQVLPPAPSAIPPTPVTTGAQAAPGPTVPATAVLPSQAFPTAPPAPLAALPPLPPDRATSPSAALAPPAAPPARRAVPPAPVTAVPTSAVVARGPAPAPAPAPRQDQAPEPPADASRAAAHRSALLSLVERVGTAVDLGILAAGAPPDEATAARLDRAIADAAAPLRGRPDVDVDTLAADARRELCEHGPLTPLLQDEDVTEIQVIRHDHVVAMHGGRQVPSAVGFTSEAAVRRVIQRLCLAAGKPLADGETFVERRLARGARLFAVMPRGEDPGHLLVLRKPQRADLTLEDLVRSGTVSRAIAGLFTQCVAARANIVVAGAAGAGATTLLGALCAAGSTDDRVVVLEEENELVVTQPHTISILLGDTPAEGARAVQAAARVRPDRLVVGALAGPVAAEVMDAVGRGAGGVIAAACAPTLRHALLRLTADVAASRPGLGADAAREQLASTFDLAIEIARLGDGRRRVLRVAELAAADGRVAVRDVFTFAVERTAAGGALEGSFHPTGVVPALVDDLAARGVAVDPSIFKPHVKADPR